MPSISRTVVVVGLVVLVGGIVSGSLGVFQQGTETCKSGYGLSITKLDENETVDPDSEPVAYSNLSATEQQVFREILTTEQTIYQNSTPFEGLTQKVVTYRSEQYETGTLFVADCFNRGVSFNIWGSLLALLGGVIVTATSGWRRLR